MVSQNPILTGVRRLIDVTNPNNYGLLFTLMKISKSKSDIYLNLHTFGVNISKSNTVKENSSVKFVSTLFRLWSKSQKN